MPSASIKKKISCSKENLIKMVLDIEKYPEFVPWCLNGKIHSKNDKGDKIEITAEKSGVLKRIDNRKIAKLAKLSGAPQSKSAGILLNVHLGELIEENQLLYTIYAESKGELNYALEYKNNHNDIITII